MNCRPTQTRAHTHKHTKTKQMRMKLINRWQSSSLSLSTHACVQFLCFACNDGRTDCLCVANCPGIIMSVTKSYCCNKLWSHQFCVLFFFFSFVVVATRCRHRRRRCHSLVIASFNISFFHFSPSISALFSPIEFMRSTVCNGIGAVIN